MKEGKQVLFRCGVECDQDKLFWFQIRAVYLLNGNPNSFPLTNHIPKIRDGKAHFGGGEGEGSHGDLTTLSFSLI